MQAHRTLHIQHLRLEIRVVLRLLLQICLDTPLPRLPLIVLLLRLALLRGIALYPVSITTLTLACRTAVGENSPSTPQPRHQWHHQHDHSVPCPDP